MARRPKVSVLTAVRNGERDLLESINSVLQQTYHDFELIVIDDHSTDRTPALLAELAGSDLRIRLVSNDGPAGLSNALNLGLTLVSGDYIARHDADDISLPCRLERQVAFLDEHADIDIVGSCIELMTEDGRTIREHREPCGPAAVYFQAMFGTPFAHPAVMMRREFLVRHDLSYRDIPAQDYDLWGRMLEHCGRGDNLPEVLVRYRVSPQSDSHVRAAGHEKVADSVARGQLRRFLGAWADIDVYCTNRCRQIAHSLFCGAPLQVHNDDETCGDAIVKLVGQKLQSETISALELNEFREAVSRRWESAWLSIRLSEVLNRKRGRWQGMVDVASRRLASLKGAPSEREVRRFIKQVPVIINVRDRLSCLTQLISWLERAGHERIIILDNQSSYAPLREYLENCAHEVMHLGRNWGHTALWQVDALRAIISHSWFVYTDPDVIPADDCPSDAVGNFYRLLRRFPKYEKAGFGLKLDDLPDHYHLKSRVLEWEAKLYGKEICPDVYEADIDTTFALYRPGAAYCYGPALRTLGRYQARHLPWYENSDSPTEEERYYRAHALPSVTTWNVIGDAKPLAVGDAKALSLRQLIAIRLPLLARAVRRAKRTGLGIVRGQR